VLAASTIALCFDARIAAAQVASADLFAPGDGLLTLDTAHGMAWLDLTATQGQSYDVVAAGFGSYTTAHGFRIATEADWKLLRDAAGILPGDPGASYEPALRLISLLGQTQTNSEGTDHWARGWYGPIGAISPGNAPMASVEAYDFLRLGVFDTNDSRPSSQELPQSGTFLVRAAQPAFSCAGFDPPMDDNVTVHKNRALPLRAQLTNATGFPVTDTSVIARPIIQVQFSSGSAPAIDVTDQALPAGQGTEGNQFVFNGGKWIFNLLTKDYTAAGTYVIKMVSGNAAEYSLQGCVAQFVINP
jgi:hypothetical protein